MPHVPRGRFSRRVSLGLLAAVLALVPAACTGSHAFHRHFEHGDLRAAERALAADSSLLTEPRAVYRAGLMYADPAGPVFDPRRARRLFDVLEGLDASPERLRAGRAMLHLVERTDSLDDRLAATRRDGELLRMRLDRLRTAFEDSSSVRRARIDSLELLADSLRSRLRRASREVAELRGKLERMREVDLEDGGTD